MKAKIRGLRWYIVALLGLATTLNYLDRQVLSVLAGTIQHELGISTIAYSQITSAFLVSYMIMYAVSGRLVDRLGTRRSFLVFVSGWSLASAVHAFARTAMQFSVCRFLLGATEPANFPAAVKAVAEWFPIRQRALAVGIFNSGSAVGAALAAPLAAACTFWWGWRSTFIAGGILGGLWVMVWYFVYRLPREHPRLSAEELVLIEDGALANLPRPAAVPIRRLLRLRETWGCVLVRFFTDPVSYFFIFWIPLFLQQERGFDLAAIGKYSGIPFVTAAIGNVAGGLFPGLLVRCGWTLNRARKTVMAVASLTIPLAIYFVLRVPTPAAAVAFISVATFFHATWGNMTVPAEVFPKHVIATVSGIGGALGSLSGAVSQQVIGWTVQTISFTPVFVAFAVLPLLAFGAVCFLVPRLGEIRDV